MYDRVCPRVVNRFQSDAKMWDRVNERIRQRFGFACVLKSSQSSSSSSFVSSHPSVQAIRTPDLDVTEYNSLAASYKSMVNIQSAMRKMSDAVGTDGSQEQRMSEITNEYGQLVQIVSGAMLEARQQALSADRKQQIQGIMSQADKLQDEFESNRKLLLCSLQRNCPLE